MDLVVTAGLNRFFRFPVKIWSTGLKIYTIQQTPSFARAAEPSLVLDQTLPSQKLQNFVTEDKTRNNEEKDWLIFNKTSDDVNTEVRTVVMALCNES